MEDARIKRIEDKIDRMSEAITTLARIEERTITIFKRIDKQDTDYENLKERVDELEDTAARRGVVYNFTDKVFWLVIGAGITVIIKMGI